MKGIGSVFVASLAAGTALAHPHFNKTVTAALAPNVEVTITYNTTPANETHAQNGRSFVCCASQCTARSPIQALECHATGSAEYQVCAAPFPGRVSAAHSLSPSSSLPRASSQRS